MTLVFLGYRYEKDVGRIAETALQPASSLPAPRLTVQGVEPVPSRRPRLFAFDLDDAGGRASALQAAVEGALESAGLHRPERRPFWPHVTFARVKSGRRAGPLEGPPPPAEAFTARDVTLYRSILRPQGAQYEPLRRLTLRGL